MIESAEVSAVIAARQGLSCSGYYTLHNRTAYLRERLYVSVADRDKLFLPQDPYEHFPAAEIDAFYLGRLKLRIIESIGAGGGKVVFTCEGPAADEGATVIAETLVGLEAVLNQPLLTRIPAGVSEGVRYKRFMYLAAGH